MPPSQKYRDVPLCSLCEAATDSDDELPCEECLNDLDERNHDLICLKVPRWAWNVLLAALEAIADAPELDDSTRHEIKNALPEIVEINAPAAECETPRLDDHFPAAGASVN